MYMLYSVVAVICVTSLSFFMASGISRLKLEQTLNYNRQQLTSLQNTYNQQLTMLHFIKEKIYSVKTGVGYSVYDSIQLILKDDKPFVSFQEYNEYVSQADAIYTFLNLVQNSLQVKMSLFLISGAGENQGNMNIIWPITNQGMIEIAKDIKPLIESRMPAHTPGIQVLSIEAKIGINRGLYILYDSITAVDSNDHAIGYIINGYTTRDLKSVLDLYSSPLIGTAYILSADGMIVFDSSEQNIGDEFELFSLIKVNEQVRHQEYVYNIIYDPTYNYYTVGKINRRELDQMITSSIVSIIVFAMSCIAIVVLLTGYLTKTVMKRIQRIIDGMLIAENGDLSARVSLSPYNDELDRIAISLNSMVAKISDHINTEFVAELRRKNAEVRQRDAELYALQTQINPHFLYNTLEIIRMKALMNGDDDSALLIKMLAALFRERITSGPVVTMKDELASCNSLIEIYNARFDGEVIVDYLIDPKTYNYGIIKGLIQPIIENAFVHGLVTTNKDDENQLILKTSQEDDIIKISVYNSGKPIEQQTLEKIFTHLSKSPMNDQSDHQFGLVNVHQRIRLVYGERCGVTITSDDHGTTVVISVRAYTVSELKAVMTSTRNDTEES
jgi:two-component system sensor histidine kinase YesM